MPISKKIKDLPTIVLIIAVLLAIIILYRLVIFLSRIFIYLGFNLFLYIDNLLKFESANPLILWGILGLFIGSIFGVIIAVKKYKLSKTLILYPLGVTLAGIIILSFINKPTNVDSTFVPVKTEETATPPVEQQQVAKVPTFTTTRMTYIYSRPLAGSRKLFTLPRGTKVGVIESMKDNRYNTWYKIEYIDPTTNSKKSGYVNASYLR